MYIRLGLCGEMMIGNVHWNLYFASAASCPIGLSGHGLTSRSNFVFASLCVSTPPYDAANITSGLSGRTAMYPLSPPPASYQSSLEIPPSARLGPQRVELSC